MQKTFDFEHSYSVVKKNAKAETVRSGGLRKLSLKLPMSVYE